MEIEKILEYESYFKKNHYNAFKDERFEILKGTCPIIVSAPHSINHIRKGKVKKADTYTGAFAIYLHKKLGVHVFYSTNTESSDPNYDDEFTSEYKKQLIRYIKENKIKFFLDLHGSDKKHNFLFDIGTDNGKTVNNRDYIEKLMMIIAEEKFKNIKFNSLIKDKTIITLNKRFKASGLNTLANYVNRKCGIPAVQLEISKLCRNVSDTYSIYMKNTLEFLNIFLLFISKMDIALDNTIICLKNNNKINMKYMNLNYNTLYNNILTAGKRLKNNLNNHNINLTEINTEDYNIYYSQFLEFIVIEFI